MSQNVRALEELDKSIQRLIDKCSRLQNTNEELELTVFNLNKKLNFKQEEICKLENKYKVLKMAKSLEGVSNENRDVKLKINEMVREIDKCIALLNN